MISTQLSSYSIRLFSYIFTQFLLYANQTNKSHQNPQNYKLESKLQFWSLRFGQFYHFSSNLKSFASGSLWFHFPFCHFSPKIESTHNTQIKSRCFVFLLRVNW
ncbi:hypothetical protein Hanom_Chr12g01125711 [Helianthus anomalus]